MSNGKRQWIKLVVIEPFPVGFGHTFWPSESRRETAKGPFYAPGMTIYDLPENRAFREWQAQGLRERGWTALVLDEHR